MKFDLRVYRLSAVKKAAYRIGDRAVARISLLDENTAEVTLQNRSTAPIEDLEADFQRETVDQELREQLSEETSRIKDLILAQAYSAVSLTDPVGDTADFAEDPLGIARPHDRHPH